MRCDNSEAEALWCFIDSIHARSGGLRDRSARHFEEWRGRVCCLGMVEELATEGEEEEEVVDEAPLERR